MAPEWIEEEVTRIRNTIACKGMFVATLREITISCADNRPEALFPALARLARQENWAFTFLPDGHVQITRLDSNLDIGGTGPIESHAA